MKQSTVAAEEGAKLFHARLNGGDFTTIYREADAELRKGATQDEFVAFLSAVHRKLGSHEASTYSRSGVVAGVNGVMATFEYESVFASGRAGERFTWRIDGDRALLVNYSISSTTLVVK